MGSWQNVRQTLSTTVSPLLCTLSCLAPRSAQEAAGWAEAAFSDPSLSDRQNVPDTHHVGVYLPFCLPAAVPLVQVRVPTTLATAPR